MSLRKKKTENKENLKPILDENDLENISGGLVTCHSVKFDENGNGSYSITIGSKSEETR